MRLIDADSIIAFINAGHLINPSALSWSDNDVVDMIESRPTIDAVPVVWTPISERQPDVYGQYLVTAVWQGELVTDFDDYFVYGWDDYGDTVVAWMPVPKPYDGERNDNE